MKLQIELVIKGLRCMKGVFGTLLKILFHSKEQPDTFLIYFIREKQLRFLIHSEKCQAILAIDPRISLSNQSTEKKDTEILVMQFKDGDGLFNSLNELTQNQGVGNVTVTLQKQKSPANEQPFRCLNLTTSTVRYRNQIFKPQYDPAIIMNHPWLNGCSTSGDRKVQFDIETEHFLNILRLIVRHKQTQSKEKTVTIVFEFSAERFHISLERLKHHAQGTISSHAFTERKYEGNYTFIIQAAQASKIYELFLGKSSGSKIYIDLENNIVFTYFQENVFESQVRIKEWINFESFAPQHPRTSEMKVEM